MKFKTRTKITGFLLLAYLASGLVCFCIHYISSIFLAQKPEIFHNPEPIRHNRHLLETEARPNCSPAAIDSFPRPFLKVDRHNEWAIVVYLFLCLYAFFALTIITDDFFIASMERIVEVLNINPDVAGATFMAAGSSAPELGTGLLGVFLTKDDIGIGTVVGSAVYNVSFVIALCALFATKTIYVKCWGLCRECIFYCVSIVVLMIIMWDREVKWSESMVLLFTYFLYMLFMFVNKNVEEYFTSLSMLNCLKPKHTDEMPSEPSKLSKELCATTEINNHASFAVESPEYVSLDVHRLSAETLPKVSITNAASYTLTEKKDEDSESPLDFPKGKLRRSLWVLALPLLLAFSFTVPNVRKDRWKNWFLIAFIMCCVWISALTYYIVWMITYIGHTWLIPEAVMGLTFLAAGASLPDSLASVLVAREGQGDMAVSNAIGSNVFDILVCLGLPWFLQTAIMSPGSTVIVYSQGLVYTYLCLLATVAFLITAVHINGWKLDKKLGVVLLIWYFLFMIISVLYQMNVFNNDNPPTCKSIY